jgi:competence protein ComFC
MLRRLYNGLIDIIYPKICLSCKSKLKKSLCVDDIICLECWGKIKKVSPPFCRRCGRHLEKADFDKNICPRCLKDDPHFDRAYAPCVYEGVLKELIHGFKYSKKDYLGRILSNFMADFIREYKLPVELIDMIIPMPLHSSRLREREFNQAQILGENLGKEFNMRVRTDVLKRVRATKTQTSLQDSQRLSNVKGSFCVTKPDSLNGKSVLMVDDVLTTGATCSEAALALKNAGAYKVIVLTLAN